jgi:hypothetical protein
LHLRLRGESPLTDADVTDAGRVRTALTNVAAAELTQLTRLGQAVTDTQRAWQRLQAAGARPGPLAEAESAYRRASAAYTRAGQDRGEVLRALAYEGDDIIYGARALEQAWTARARDLSRESRRAGRVARGLLNDFDANPYDARAAVIDHAAKVADFGQQVDDLVALRRALRVRPPGG